MDDRRNNRAGAIRRQNGAGRHDRDHSLAAVIELGDERATDDALVGNKAAALARARRAGLPVLDGFVVTTATGDLDLSDGVGPDADPATRWSWLCPQWSDLSDHDRHAVVVRSSTTSEDSAESSQAGQFTSVVDVRGFADFATAVDRVRASVSLVEGAGEMAVLVQRHLDAALGGVLFTLDPVTGDRDTIVVELVESAPVALVDGSVPSTRVVLSRRGRLRRVDAPTAGTAVVPAARVRRRLARLARRVERHGGSPRDIEWAIDRDGALWLLQHRPVTAVGGATGAGGPVLGPGPVAETFPDPLRPLERDLWLEPLDGALRAALDLVRGTSRRRLQRPVALDVRGWAAVDLEALGVERQRGAAAAFDPRGPARRLGAAWRIGRLRRALPLLADDLVAQLDEELRAVPPLPQLDDVTVAGTLAAAQARLVALGAHEVLAGMLLDDRDDGATAPAAALAAVRRAAANGRPTDLRSLAAEAPETLVLQAPAAFAPDLDLAAVADVDTPAAFVEDLGAREALRLRIRWLHELIARLVEEAGHRLAARGDLARLRDVTLLRFDELDAALRHGAPVPPPAVLAERFAPGPPLPARFRLTEDGTPMAAAEPAAGTGGRPAGGGLGRGLSRVHGDGELRDGEILVVGTLAPGLAPLLPRLGGLVAETGSALSHLAILAREVGIPTVVDVPDARRRFPTGTRLTVDGMTGAVEHDGHEGQDGHDGHDGVAAP